eukprot:CAMPEP_0204831080 /NCGR_PEP_ID=MMETSP1346-20131115/9796_1 /ASSEMBLY_ACC=CAM_ASM_000771 /TAXON_ID=215587 /ORGANISM="Aplanochytrium stocchinoi, Strain GSBS06" /LENGTH=797 /DNA_ID=CAMNT_0051961809 /DNA_START=100 /DNA_END=2493 /DNA_ORIENTATION=+
MEARRIFRLDATVVNRIAAGEVVHRPSSAAKELIENCIDAGSTSVQVTVKGGGTKMLSIQDNGCGIKKEDLEIVCERFTTSKLKQFEDLETIATYGFRGEALASITHVAKVTITSKTKETPCAFRAMYLDGKLAVDPKTKKFMTPKPCAGLPGTTIKMEDLFYNVPARRRAMKRESEEYRRILDVVSKYAIHCGLDAETENEKEGKNTTVGVGFVCKNVGGKAPDVHTNPKGTKLDHIRSLHGSTVANELLRIDCTETMPDIEKEFAERLSGYGNSEGLSNKWTIKGYVSNANYSRKQSNFILFINNRLVGCSSLKRAVELVYSEYLPKGGYPFVYLSLELPSRQVDVNVHPTKHEVHFLNEEHIVQIVQDRMREILVGANSSRVFYTQTTLTDLSKSVDKETVSASTNTLVSETSGDFDGEDSETTEMELGQQSSRLSRKRKEKENEINITQGSKPSQNKNKKPYRPNKLVRTDFRAPSGGIEQFLVRSDSTSDSRSIISKDDKRKEQVDELDDNTYDISEEASTLTSVKDLIAGFETRKSDKLSSMLAGSVYVGVIDNTLMMMQYKTGLYLVDYTELNKELFYQLMLQLFGRCRRLQLENPPLLKNLILLCLSTRAEKFGDPSKNENESTLTDKCSEYVSILLEKKEMLDEYFRIRFDGDDVDSIKVSALPELIEGYIPQISALPLFLVRLCEEIDWDEEEACFRTLSWEVSEFYSQLPSIKEEKESETVREQVNEKIQQSSLVDDTDTKYILKNVLYPAYRSKVVPPTEFADPDNFVVVRMACLENLYKIFERC